MADNNGKRTSCFEKDSHWGFNSVTTELISKWVSIGLQIKAKNDVSINQWEARLISKGYKQKYRIDYDETFALATEMTSAREVIMCMSMAFVMHFFL